MKPDKGHNDIETLKVSKGTPNAESENNDKPQRAALAPIQPPNNVRNKPADQPAASLQSVPEQRESLELLAPATDNNDLSIIAEDEEPSERSRSSTSGSRIETTSVSLPVRMPTPPPIPELPPVPEMHTSNSSLGRASNTSHRESNAASISSMDTFHSIPLDSSADLQRAEMEEPLPAEPEMEPMVIEEDTGPLPVLAPISVDTSDHVMADSQDEFAPPATRANEKPLTAPSFPTLPEPMPLRKSMRPPRDPSMTAVMGGAATPGAPAGKRTSWLMKAREIKKLETGKKSYVPPVPASGPVFEPTAPLVLGTKRKSGDMLEMAHSTPETEERQAKVVKTIEGESAPRKSKEKAPEPVREPPESSPPSKPPIESVLSADISQEGAGVLNLLKKTVEGLGVRVGMGKSLGGGAATVLAEARAAAEARLAERDRKEDEMTMALGLAAASTEHAHLSHEPATRQNEGRLSVSDLFPAEGRMKEKHRVPEKVFHKATPPPTFHSKEHDSTRMSTSTTPPNSPPAHSSSSSQPMVFSKPPPVFVPPTSVQTATTSKVPSYTKDFAFRPPSPPKYQGSTSMALGFSPRFQSSTSPKGKTTMPLTAQSTIESIQSDKVFDDDVPAWMPSTQDTEYTSAYGSQSQPQTQICDEDDSWPVDEKLAAGVQWTYGASKEDSMTWSTLPSQSQRADTGPVTKTSPIREERSVLDTADHSRQIPGSFDDMDMDMQNEEVEEDLIPRDAELEEIVLGSKSTVSLVKVSSRFTLKLCYVSNSNKLATSTSSAECHVYGFIRVFAVTSWVLRTGLQTH